MVHATVSFQLALISFRSSKPTPAPTPFSFFFFQPVLIILPVPQTVVGAHEDNRASLHESASDLSLVKG